MKTLAILAVSLGILSGNLAAQTPAPPPELPPTPPAPSVNAELQKGNSTIVVSYHKFRKILRVNYVEWNQLPDGSKWFQVSAARPDTANDYGVLQLPGITGAGATLKEALKNLALKVWKEEQR